MVPIKKYNNFWKRFLAGLIDGILFLPIGYFLLFKNNTDKDIYVINNFIYLAAWYIYVVYMEGRNGQTWGKMALGIKIFDLNEIDNIGYKRAFYRECIPMVLSVLGLLYVLFFGKPNSHGKWGDDDIFSLIQSFWFIAELVTMLFSIKRRAIHDLIAHSVVINISELKREHIQRERIEILETLKATSPT